MAKGERVFNNRPRKVFRKHIPKGEALFGAVFLVFVGSMIGWFAAQKNNYNPADRDISMETMEQDAVVDELWRMPLHTWVEPGTQVAAAGGVVPAVDTGVFPPTLLEGGWSLAGRVQPFTAETLYEKVDGAAEQNIQFGLTHAFFAGMEKPAEQLSINIEVYDQDSFANALGIFSAQRDANKEVIAETGAYYYLTTVGAIGIAGPYYFKITGAQEGEATIAKAKQLVGMMAQMAQGKGDVPAAFGLFVDKLGVPFSAIQFQKSDVFQFDFAKDFWFAQPQENGPKMFLHEAATPEEARTLLDKLVQNNLFDYEAVEQADGRAVLKHKYLGEYLLLQESGSMVYGIDGAPDLNAAQQQAQQLQGAFSQ